MQGTGFTNSDKSKRPMKSSDSRLGSVLLNNFENHNLTDSKVFTNRCHVFVIQEVECNRSLNFQ